MKELFLWMKKIICSIVVTIQVTATSASCLTVVFFVVVLGRILFHRQSRPCTWRFSSLHLKDGFHRFRSHKHRRCIGEKRPWSMQREDYYPTPFSTSQTRDSSS